MCIFCENIYSAGVMVCQECSDYKGLMTLSNAIDYLNLDPNDFN